MARLDAEIEKFLLPHKLNTYRFVQFILFYFYLYFPFFFSSFFFLFVLGVEAFVSDRRMRKSKDSKDFNCIKVLDLIIAQKFL